MIPILWTKEYNLCTSNEYMNPDNVVPVVLTKDVIACLEELKKKLCRTCNSECIIDEELIQRVIDELRDCSCSNCEITNPGQPTCKDMERGGSS